MKKFIIILVIILIVAGIAVSVAQSLKGKIVFNDILKFTPIYTPPKTEQQAPKVVKNTTNTKNTATSSPKVQEPKPPTPPDGFSVDDLSPYYKKASISGFVRPSYSASLKGKFIIRFSGNKDETIDITGWKLRGNRGAEVYIPQASRDYTLSGWTPYENIVLGSGNFATVYSERSTVNKNFRLNKCIGYLNNLYTFNPTLPSSCPAFEKKQTVTFSGACQTFLSRLRSCKEPTSAEKNMFTGPADSACRAFLDTLNYGGCYKAHRADNDFFSNEWRVWLNEEMLFDTQHDRLVLYDKNGKVVNEYIY